MPEREAEPSWCEMGERTGFSYTELEKQFTELSNSRGPEISLPGVAGQAGAHDCVEHSQGEVPAMELTVHPLVWENIRRIADG